MFLTISIAHSGPATIVLSSNNTDVIAGDTVYLMCVAYGDPPLSVGWLRGDRELSNGSRVTVYEEEREMEGGESFLTSVLEVCSVGQSDAGEYSCIAANSRGNSSAIMELTVSSPSKLETSSIWELWQVDHNNNKIRGSSHPLSSK